MRGIYCAGSQGRVVLDILRAKGEASDVVFLDDDTSCHGTKVDGVSVIGGIEALESTDESVRCLIALGTQPGRRLEIARSVEEAGGEFFSACHPDATVSECTTLGEGVTVNARTYLGPGVTLENHVLVDSCVNASHDVALETGATITPNATLAGNVTVGQEAYVGPGATIVRDVNVGPGAVVGAGAVVTDNVDADATVVGVPATPV